MNSRRAGDGAVDEPERMRTVVVGDGRQLSYAEYGDPDGEPVLLFHGTPGSRLLGQLFDEEARRHGIRLLSPDRPGYGRSTPCPGRTLSDTGTFVAPVLDDAGISRTRVVGFSGGGAYALALAATHGERVSEIDVVSSATPPSLRPSTPAVQRLLGAIGQRTPRVLGGLFRGPTGARRRGGRARQTGLRRSVRGASDRCSHREPALYAGVGPLDRGDRSPSSAVARGAGYERSDRRRSRAVRSVAERPANRARGGGSSHRAPSEQDSSVCGVK
ncbi:alpha/beta fold hydrolase [Halomontanus rarus]|uniref:alpha/beta fold hydrolase n=1 Tax=Halomontanus rarus TaxID=3034020 RepID=UPI003CE4C755